MHANIGSVRGQDTVTRRGCVDQSEAAEISRHDDRPLSSRRAARHLVTNPENDPLKGAPVPLELAVHFVSAKALSALHPCVHGPQRHRRNAVPRIGRHIELRLDPERYKHFIAGYLVP